MGTLKPDYVTELKFWQVGQLVLSRPGPLTTTKQLGHAIEGEAVIVKLVSAEYWFKPVVKLKFKTLG